MAVLVGAAARGGSGRRDGVAVGKRSGERQMGINSKKEARKRVFNIKWVDLTWELMLLVEEGPVQRIKG